MSKINKLPEMVTVLGVPYRVELVPELQVDGDPCHGVTIGLNHRMRVEAGLDTSRQWSTLLHEYIHAVLYTNGVSSVIPYKIEEVIAQSLEYGILELLRQHGATLTKVAGGTSK